jgi:predicted O-linked N-acetylglucosamine transferase (SPINDLY family)
MTPTIQTAMDLHRQGRLREAEAHYRVLLAKHPRQFEVLHLLGTLKLQERNLPEAVSLLTRAIEANPASNDTRSNLVAALLSMGRASEALDHCDRMLSNGSQDAGVLYNRSVALAGLDRQEEALRGFDKVLAIKPDHVAALFNRAGVLATLRRYDDAVSALDRILTFAPNHPDALTNRGTMLAQLGRDAEALASFDRALAVAPDHVNALTNRGIILKRLFRAREALESLDRAIRIKPDHLDAYINRGNVLLDLHQAEAALASFHQALTLAPGHPNALINQAFALLELGRYEDALQSGEQALLANSRHDNAFLIRGHALSKLNRPAEAAASYEQALAINPDQRFALGAMVMAHRAACNWDRLHDLLPMIEQSIRAGEAVIPPFNLLGLPLDPGLPLQCAKNFLRQRVPQDSKPLQHRPRSAGGKIKLAYVSGDFRQHPVAYLMSELLEKHDRSRFEIVGVSYGADDGSQERGRIVAACDQFHDVHARDDRDAAALINDLQVDIAVDLGGHTDNSRLGIFRDRPAPVQVSYLGYTGTTGAPFVDYAIADRVALPPDQSAYFTENIVYLPDSFLVSDAARPIAPTTSRADEGLPEQGFVFCCFNNSYKISAEIFATWMRLLLAVDGSVLWLSQMNAPAAERLRTAAASAGVDPIRIVFAQRKPSASDHLGRHRLADLFVDTTGYNAHTTSNDALWAGLPVLTCAGVSFPSRVAASLLCAVGLPELVTTSLEDYEALALKLARDPALLGSFRGKLEKNRLTHPLFDSNRFRGHIEAAYATMWDIQQRGEQPRSFDVGTDE